MLKKSTLKKEKIAVLIKAVNVPADRGKNLSCDLCNKDFNKITVREHQCKRCKRAVCENCAQHKAVVLQYQDKGAHRQCFFCRAETDSIKKFILDNQLVFMKDSISKDWLYPFQIDNEIAENDYQKAKMEAQSTAPNSEVIQMNNGIYEVYAELDDYLNYSLRDFFWLLTEKLDYKKINEVIQSILQTFLTKYPQVGWSPDLVTITKFFLCFSSEAVAYELLTILYGSIIPPYLYNTNLRTKNYEYLQEIEMMMLLADQGLKVPTADTNNLNYFMKARISRYIHCLTINLMLMESSFFIINQTFQAGGEKGYFDFLRALVAVLSQQSQQIRRANVNYDEAELSIMRNVKSEQSSGLFLQSKKINIEQQFKIDPKARQQSIISKSSEIVKEKQEQQKIHQDALEQQIIELKTTCDQLTVMIDKQKVEIEKKNKEKQDAIMKLQMQNGDYLDMKEKYEGLVESNQALQLELMKRTTAPMMNNQSGSSQREMIELKAEIDSLIFEKQELLKQNDKKTQELEDRNQEILFLNEKLEQQESLNKQNKLNLDNQSNRIRELEAQVLKQSQEIEILNLRKDTFSVIDSDIQTERLNKILLTKNEEISNLSAQVNEEQQKQKQLQGEIVNLNDNISLLNNEKQVLKNQITSLNNQVESLQQQLIQTQNQIQAQVKTETTNMQIGTAGLSIQVIMRDLEDGKNMVERKNTEIIQLKKELKKQEETINRLNNQMKSLNLTVEQQEQDSKDFFQVMRRATQVQQDALQLEQDFDLLLEDVDPSKRAAAGNIKNKFNTLEKEVLYRQTEAQIKQEQLQPFKNKSQQLERKVKELEGEIQNLNKQLEQKVQEQQEQKQLQVIETQIPSYPKPRPQIMETDPNILKENSQACTQQDCQIF